MSEAGGCCRWCVAFQLSLGFTALFLWLSFRPIEPRFYLVAFQISPFANRSAALPPGGNVTATFRLEIENKNKRMGICHDPLAVSLSYAGGGGRNGSTVTILGFCQGHGKTADKDGEAGAGWTVSRASAAAAKANGTTMSSVFRVGVEAAFRYKVLAWKSRHHGVRVGADVEVDGEGKKNAEKGIRLSSAPATARCGLATATIVVILFLPLF